jgi:hypothetical protein
MAEKPKRTALDLPDIELLPDAWERFERGVKAAAKAGPQHRDQPAAKAPQLKAGRLTPAEVEKLRKHGKEVSAYARKAFAKKTKPA